MSERHAVMCRPGGRWEVIRLEANGAHEPYYVTIAEARDVQAAREIAASLNAKAGAR